MVEACETLFEPVVIHNNAKGKDAEILARFEEPAWNNPVVRLLSGDGKDLVPRVAEDWTIAGLLKAMQAALEKAERPVPGWFQALVQEEVARHAGLQTAIFGMT